MRQIELICVTADNNNKFYRMFEEGDTFRVEYGRVGYTPTSETYSISLWNKKYNEKLKKGYKDVSEYKKVSSTGKLTFPSLGIEEWFKRFENYTKIQVHNNYTIDVNIVTQLMIDDAQVFINSLLVKPDNQILLDLYKILPRRLANVKDVLFTGKETEEQIKERINKEQQILDSLSSNVASIVTEDQSLDDLLGVEIRDSSFDANTVMASTNTSQYKPYKVFSVKHPNRTIKFDTWLNQQQNKHTELLIHGTRNANIFSILKQGLILRPTNAVISGAVYGNGIYHSAHTNKSLNYTGYDPDKIFLLQSTHMGNPYQYNGWYRAGKDLDVSDMNYNSLKKKGYDSLFVKAGDGLLNSEYIVYNEEQTNTSYLVWMK